MRRAWSATWPHLGIGACAVALAFIPRDAWWWGLAAGALLGAANVIGWHEGRRYALRWRRERDNAREDEIAARRVASAAVKAHLTAENTIRALRAEVASLRRQNLALDAQLDHMTRVNQALDAGITTTSTQERA